MLIRKVERFLAIRMYGCILHSEYQHFRNKILNHPPKSQSNPSHTGLRYGGVYHVAFTAVAMYNIAYTLLYTWRRSFMEYRVMILAQSDIVQYGALKVEGTVQTSESRDLLRCWSTLSDTNTDDAS